MHLELDAPFPFLASNGARSKCRVRVYSPDDPERDSHVVLVSELPDNPGSSVTNSAEVIAAEAMARFHLIPPVVFVEHYPQASTGGIAETFDLVVFAHLEVRRIARVEDVMIREVGPPSAWRPLDRSAVETLVGEPLTNHCY
jgi:hypothetical protein